MFQGRLSERQKTRFIDLMSRYYKLLFGRFSSAKGVDLKENKWGEIMDELNTMGTEKTLDQWKKCWADLKKGAKEKLTAIQQYRNKTGGGPQCPTTLTDQDQIIVNICGLEALTGVLGVELGVDEVSPVSSQSSSESRRRTNDLSSRTGRDGSITPSISASLPRMSSVVSSESQSHTDASSRSSSIARTVRDETRLRSTSMSNDREKSSRSISVTKNSDSSDRRLNSPSYSNTRTEINGNKSTHHSPPAVANSGNPLSSGRLLSHRIGRPWAQSGLRIDNARCDESIAVGVGTLSVSRNRGDDSSRSRTDKTRRQSTSTSSNRERSRSRSISTTRSMLRNSGSCGHRSRSRTNSITRSERNGERSTNHRPANENNPINRLSSGHLLSNRIGRSRAASRLRIDDARCHSSIAIGVGQRSVVSRNRYSAGLSSSRSTVISASSHESQLHADASPRPRSIFRTDRHDTRHRSISSSSETSRSVSTLRTSRNDRMSSDHSVSGSYRSRSRSNSMTRSVASSYYGSQSSIRTEFRIPDHPVRRNLTGTLAFNVEEAGRVQKNIERKVSLMCDQQGDVVDVLKDVLLELRNSRQNNG